MTKRLHGALQVTIAILGVFTMSACVSSGGPGGYNSGDRSQESDRPDQLISTSADSWVETPWFSVSSVVVQVTATQHRTVIVLPEESIIRDYMRYHPDAVLNSNDIPESGRLMFKLGIVTDGAQPFVEPDPER